MMSQEDVERILASEYLRFKNAKPRNLKVLSEFRPDHKTRGVAGPDVRVTCDWDRSETKVGIELTGYHVDRSPEGSLAMRESSLWEKILHRLWCDHFPAKPSLAYLEVRITFRKSNPLCMRVVDKLAAEIASFLDSRADTIQERAYFHRYGTRRNNGDFEAYPILKEYLTSIIASRSEFSSANRRWQLGGAAHVGIVPNHIVDIIEQKSAKFHKYDITGTDQAWLLIHASAETCSSTVGPPDTGETANIELSQIRELAAASGFDRIVFWERAFKWDFEIPQGRSLSHVG